MPIFHPRQEHPGYVTGKYYATFLGRSATTNAVAAIDTIYLYPFRVFSLILVKTLVVRTVTGGAGSSVKMALWADSSVSHRPLGAPLVVDNTGLATTGSGTNQEADVTDTLFYPGWYWAGAKFTGTLPQMVAIDGTVNNAGFWTGTAIAMSARPAFSFADTYSNNMPTFAEGASFTEASVNGVPIIGLGL